MPQVDYSNSTIYKLCCKDTSIKDIYIGSTTNFRQRKSQHKNCCNNENNKHYNYRLYKFIRENGGFDNWEMFMIEEFKCENKLQKLKLSNVFRVIRTSHNLNLRCACGKNDIKYIS